MCKFLRRSKAPLGIKILSWLWVGLFWVSWAITIYPLPVLCGVYQSLHGRCGRRRTARRHVSLQGLWMPFLQTRALTFCRLRFRYIGYSNSFHRIQGVLQRWYVPGIRGCQTLRIGFSIAIHDRTSWQFGGGINSHVLRSVFAVLIRVLTIEIRKHHIANAAGDHLLCVFVTAPDCAMWPVHNGAIKNIWKWSTWKRRKTSAPWLTDLIHIESAK